MKKYIYSFLVACLACLAFSSCSDVQIPDAVSAPKAENLSYQVDGRTVTLNWTLPGDDNKSGVDIYRNNSLLESLGIVNTATLELQPARTNLLYTVKMKYADGRMSEGNSVNVYIDAEPAKPAMLIAANSESELEDDDEIAAVQWFKQTYGDDGIVLTPNEFKNVSGNGRDKYSMIWIQIDRVGIGYGVANLPACITDEAVLAKLKDFSQAGGNILLTKHATQLVPAFGRIDSKFAPGLFSDGNGGEGTDIWTTNAVIGSSQSPSYDHRSHAAFVGLDVLPAGDPIDNYDHESYPLEGPGWREDHNCMWDLNAYDLPSIVPTAANVVDAFQQATNCTVLSTWGHVTDYCCAGIVEFNANESYKGKTLCIGLSAYEFKQNSGTNQYQGNIEKLTKNCIDYLAK